MKQIDLPLVERLGHSNGHAVLRQPQHLSVPAVAELSGYILRCGRRTHRKDHIPELPLRDTLHAH